VNFHNVTLSRTTFRALSCLAALALRVAAQGTPPATPSVAPRPLTFAQLLALPAPTATARLPYGPEALQRGELRLPKGKGPFPIVVLLHGGCWLAQYDAAYMPAMGAALADDGFAVWTPEFRRIGDPGGGYPGTLLDAARAVDFVREIAQAHPIDTTRVVLAGHSAGGHLALLVAARHKLKRPHPLAVSAPLPLTGVVSIDGISDLAGYAGTTGCAAAVPRLMGGMPPEQPERYALNSPIDLVRTRMVHGSLDTTVPLDQSRAFARKAFAAGDDAQVIVLEHSAHFDPVAPTSADWPSVLGAIRAMSRGF
jgi:acetyl esterase/lipase